MNKNYDYVLQQTSNDCGIACMMTILMYYGIKPSRENIITKVKQKRDGYTAYDLIQISKSYNLDAYGIKTDIKSVEKLPAIAHTIKDKNLFHFIVILEIGKDIKIMDPAEGIKRISFEEFEEITTGIFLIFKGQKKKRAKDKRFKKEIISICKTNKKIIIQTLFLSLIFISFSLAFNYYLKIVLSIKSISLLFLVAIIFLNICVVKNFISFIRNRLMLNLSIKIDKEITKKLSNHIFNLPYKYFIKKRAGELVTIIDDIENFKEVVTKIFILSVVDLILIGTIICYMCFLNIYIGISLTIIIILLIIITKKYQYIINDNFTTLKVKKINYTSSLINFLTSFETIKNLNISKKVINLLNEKYNDTLNISKKYNKKIYNYDFTLNLFTDICYLFLLFVSSFLVLKAGMDYLDIVLFSSIFYMITGLLSNILESISLYKVYQTGTDRILDCLEQQTEKFNKTLLSEVNTITFKNVKYQTDVNILDNINLNIKKGDKVYITGKSGIGKSTMMKLLLKYYVLTSGEIKIDNINIEDLDLSFIRENITYIGQNEELFPGTIKDNLNLASTSAEDQEKVSKITLLDDFLKENKIDYNYLIDESGFNLSGGERKKIILARGLLKFKNVLILDEVFNEISIEEERKILNNIFTSYKDKIIIMISHRSSNKNLFNKKYKLKGDGNLYEIK